MDYFFYFENFEKMAYTLVKCNFFMGINAD